MGAGSRKRRKERNPKGWDKIRARKIEATGRGEVISRTNGKIRSKDGPGKSRRDLVENKDPRQKGTKEETMGRRIRRKKRLEQVDMSALYFVKKKKGEQSFSSLRFDLQISYFCPAYVPFSGFQLWADRK